MVTGIQLDAQLHERIFRLKEGISEGLTFNRNSLGISAMLGLLLDHWEHVPPAHEWLKVQAELYPKRGRPRKSEPADMTPIIAGKKQSLKGHDLFRRRKNPGRYAMCKNCNLTWDTINDSSPAYKCPTIDGSLAWLQRKIWTKSELRGLNFEDDEIQWAAD